MLKNKKKKGFTLIELIVVIAILGILAAVLIPRFSGFTDKAKSTQALTYAKQIATAIDSYAAEQDVKISVADANFPTDATAQAAILKLAGLTTGDFTSWTPEADGGFTVVAGGFTAGRATGNDKVAVSE